MDETSWIVLRDGCMRLWVNNLTSTPSISRGVSNGGLYVYETGFKGIVQKQSDLLWQNIHRSNQTCRYVKEEFVGR